MTPLVAIDPGANTGWASVDAAGKISHGSWKLGPSTATVGCRINTLAWRLGEVQSRFLPAYFVCEDQFIRKGVEVSVRPLLKYQGAVQAHCDRAGLNEPWLQDPSCACKAYGSPHLTKDERVRRANLMGYAVETHDEADALGHLLWRIGIMRQQSLGIPDDKLRRKRTR